MPRASADHPCTGLVRSCFCDVKARLGLISTDFDGTLFLEDETPPVPEAWGWMWARLRTGGARWVINTGRDGHSLRAVLEQHGLRFRPDFLVLVEREIYVWEEDRYASLKPWNDACEHQHRQLFEGIQGELPALVSWIRDRFDARVYEDAYSPFCLVAANLADADLILAHVEDRFRGHPELMVMRNDVYARLNHRAYTKGTAMSEIARRLGVQVDGILAAGDHFNDLPMLCRQRARYLVAPGNAIVAVQEHVRRWGGYVSRWRGGTGLLDGIGHFTGVNVQDFHSSTVSVVK